MAGRRHGLSILDAGQEEWAASSLAELEQFILAAGKARGAAGIGPNASLHLDGIWRERAEPGWGAKSEMVERTWPKLDPETLRVYLEALEEIFARQLSGPGEYTRVVTGHGWSRHPFYGNTEYCRSCGLTIMLERDTRGELLGVQVSSRRQGAVETAGSCGGEKPDWEWGYFLPEGHGNGMRRVDDHEWYGEIRRRRGEG